MNFEIEIRGKGRPNTAFVTVTTIGSKSALEVTFQREPTAEALEAVSAAIDQFMKGRYGPSANLRDRIKVESAEHLHELTRKHLGGEKG